jgi:hypothetical protein
MKTLSSITKTILVCLLFIAAGQPAWSHDEYSKVIRKEYPVNPDAQFTIENKFGKIHCNNWDKNVISIEVKITVEAGSETTANNLMDKITIAMTGSPSLVEVRTQIGDGSFSGRTKVNVDYMISMPAGISLDATNKFGDIFINELTGKAKINISYGNLEVNRFDNSDNLLDIKFSKANIKSLKGAVLMLKYSEMDLDYAGSLRLDSKYSNLDAGKIISLSGSFEGGKLDMDNSSVIDSKSKFSDLSITRIEKSLTLDIQYGNCDVDEMPADFTSINVKNKYANISIGISEAASYVLDATLKFCELDFPEGAANFSQKVITNTSKSYHATVGKNPATTSKVNVNSEFGNVSLE